MCSIPRNRSGVYIPFITELSGYWRGRGIVRRPALSILLFICSSSYRFGILIVQIHCSESMMDPDFDAFLSNAGTSSDQAKGNGKTNVGMKRQNAEQKGEPRKYLKVWETVPSQLLNAYGLGSWQQKPHEAVWEQLVKPLPTGAMYMTELADSDVERRGVGINRWLLSVQQYMLYQRKPAILQQNERMLKDEFVKGFYSEIESLLPPLKYCLAPKKVGEKKGASALRSGGIVEEEDSSSMKSATQLDDHAKVLYDWFSRKPSYVRMLMNWQAQGGLPHVSATHHLAATCFINYGNKYHNGTEVSVSLSEFQAAVRSRHRLGSNGITEDFE